MTLSEKDLPAGAPTGGISHPSGAATGADVAEFFQADAPDPVIVEREFTVAARSQFRTTVRRFLRHRGAVISSIVFLFVIGGSLIFEHIWQYSYLSITNDINQSPSWGHPFGTDANGDDLFAQTMRGVQTSAEIGFLVAFLSTGFGTIYGAVAGFYSGATDSVLMRFVDLVLTIPALAVLLVLSASSFASGGGALPIAVVLSALGWASISRVIRGLVLSLREKEFIEAARALGASNRRIIFRHLLPNVTGAVIVNATIAVSLAIVTEAGLSYLGFGVKAPNISLGLLIENGIGAADTRPWLFYLPGLVLVVIALTISFIGDGLRDALDPQQNRVRA